MKNFLLAISFILIGLSACKKVHYEWEDYTYTAVPIVTIDTTKTAPPTVTRQTAKVSFFNLKDANLANEQFSFALNWQGFGLATVSSIEVYTSFNKAEPSVPAYPIVISSPGNQYPNIAQFPLPSLVGTKDKLLETVTTFPKTYTYTAAQLATLNSVALNSAAVNDYFLFKFILNLTDGRRIVTFFNNICDESRGEPGDCRTGVRFKSF